MPLEQTPPVVTDRFGFHEKVVGRFCFPGCLSCLTQSQWPVELSSDDYTYNRRLVCPLNGSMSRIMRVKLRSTFQRISEPPSVSTLDLLTIIGRHLLNRLFELLSPELNVACGMSRARCDDASCCAKSSKTKWTCFPPRSPTAHWSAPPSHPGGPRSGRREAVCTLNGTQTVFPGTHLQLIFEIGSSKIPPD